jgi:hypothetical protein
MRTLRLRSVFLAGCITLAAPGLLMSGFTAVQAWTAWSSAQVAASGAQAAGEVMRTATLLMVERGRLQNAAFAADPKLATLTQASADSNLALARAEQALQSAGLPFFAIDRCSAAIWMIGRIASPEMLPAVWSLPHLICSRRGFGGGGGDEAGEHGDAR